MAANFNFTYSDDIDGNADGLIYRDSNENEVEIASYGSITSFVTGKFIDFIAPPYTKKTYPANSLVYYYNYSQKTAFIYYNPNAIETAENWNPNHWTRTTVADYIKLMITQQGV